MDWLAAMNRRLRLTPPKHRLAHFSGSRMRPIRVAVGGEDVDAVEALAAPARGRPHVAVGVAADPVGAARAHVGEEAPVRHPRAPPSTS